MPKYKYVDGVKYRVVPQSVLGYALVREGSDNSLPVGGTDGQVLTKASNTDYDVEWTTVESGCNTVIIDIQNPDAEPPLSEETATAYYNAIDSGKVPIIKISRHLFYVPHTLEKITEEGMSPTYVLYWTSSEINADENKVTMTDKSFGISLNGFSGFGAEHSVILRGNLS